MKKSFLVLSLILPLVFLLNLFTSHTLALPIESIKPTDYVTDYTNTLSKVEVLEISKILGNLEREKKYPVSVVMVPDMSGDYLENYAKKLYEKLKIGNKEKDEGLLFLISKNERLMRIEVGYGLEPILTDGITKNIQNNFVRPYFKNNDYYGGIKSGVEKINEILGGPSTGLSNNKINSFSKSISNNISGNLFGILVFIFMFGVNILAWIVSVMARTKSWWLGGVISFCLGFPFLFFLGFTLLPEILLFIFTITGFIFDYFVSKNYKYWESEFSKGGKRDKNILDNNSLPAWWAGGSWGPFGSSHNGSSTWTNSSGFDGFGGGGSSGGGGSNSSW